MTNLFGLSIFDGSFRDCVTRVETHLLQKNADLLSIFTPNPEQIVLAHHDSEFLRILQTGDLLIPDGSGLLTAARWQGKKIAERITGTDLATALVETAQKHHKKVLLIGGRGYKVPYDPDFFHWTPAYQQVKHPTSQEEAELKTLISHFKPNIIFVAFGAPEQEKWIAAHREFLEQEHVSVVMAVGGAFDFVFGKLHRAPQWAQRAGAEWLYRLIQEPWRWKRQLKLIEFGFLSLRAALH